MPALVKRCGDHTLRIFDRMRRAASEADGLIVAKISRRVLNPGPFA